MEGVLGRLGAVETSATDIKARLRGVESTVSDIKAQVAGITSVMPHLATKADINALKADINALRSDVHARESSSLKWLIGTLIASMALACTLAGLIR